MENTYDMDTPLTFINRAAFRDWLHKNGARHQGIWLLFGKKGGPVTLTAGQALEEALCFGWIDGQMVSLGDHSYKKYFARRRAKSNWSEKNKLLAQTLIEKGWMTESGQQAIDQAKKNGCWEHPQRVAVDARQMERFKELIRPYEPAYSHLLAMPPSVLRTYTGFYLDAKSEATRQKRLMKIIDRLSQNLKPM